MISSWLTVVSYLHPQEAQILIQERTMRTASSSEMLVAVVQDDLVSRRYLRKRLAQKEFRWIHYLDVPTNDVQMCLDGY